MRILLAEDDRVSALIVRRVLEGLGHHIDSCDSGREAWAMIQSGSYDIVISDWMMPDIDGLELCRLMREQPGRTYTYYILLTAKSERKARIEALANGVDDFLVKPLDKEELVGRLASAQRVLDMQDELHNHTGKLNMTMGYLETANRRFSDLFMGLPVASITFDTYGRIMEWNRASEALYQRDPQEVWQADLVEIIADKKTRKWAKSFVQRALRGESIENEECSFIRRDGRARHVTYSTFPLRNNLGEILGAVCTCNDLTERRELEQKLEEQLHVARQLNETLELQSRELAAANARLAELANTDGLTGLKNHRYYNEVLLAHVSEAKRHGKPISVVLCDIDHFKQFNDTYGHPAGDQLLREFAALLSGKVRAEDIVARHGGEEFVVVLPNADQRSALMVAEKLRQAIEAHPWPERPITASFGVSTLVPAGPGYDASELVDLSDRALYASKQAGRNRVTHATEVLDDFAGKTAA